jgi:hypothetical protein
MKQSQPDQVLSWHLPEETEEKPCKTLDRLITILANIQTNHFPHTSLDHYWETNVFSVQREMYTHISDYQDYTSSLPRREAM